MAETMDRLRSALADRYEVQRELGRGGMATVYLAQDRKHGRQVAIKVLKPELAATLGAERFLREIALAAKLRHPHILPLYDSGEVPASETSPVLLYYVMPYVEGQSLRNRQDREKQLPTDDAIQIARDVAGALEYAHKGGVVHRDIKPENILLESGHAVVTDFGIARALSEAADVRLTEAGLSMGTPAYMSPEQSASESDVDGRSDIYSLGCVLYEMLTGSPPFTGSTPVAVIARHATDPVPSIRSVRGSIRPALEDVVLKALAKVPADRPQTAGEFAAALAATQTDPGGVPSSGVGVPSAGTSTRTLLKPSFWSELERRKVYQVAVVYGAVSWVAIQVVDTIGPTLNLSESLLRYIVVAAVAGLPLALFLAWAYQLTPDGVQRTQPIRVGEPPPAVRPGRRRLLVVAGTAVLVALAVTIFRTWAPSSDRVATRSESGAVADTESRADPAVAVLPFQTSGQDLEFLREGIVHLLAAVLEGVEGLRKIDPGTVMNTWNSGEGEGRENADLDDAVDLARRTGARYAVTGSAVQTGRAVRLIADVYDAGEERPRGSAQVDGTADDLLSLVDRLALELVTRNLLPGDPNRPPANMSRVTTTSLPALKAYLAGEQKYQEGRWSEAAAEYERAVDLDPTFVRAMYRLSVAYTWAGRGDLASEYLDRAIQFADSLPERDALLLRGAAAPMSPDIIPTLERLTDRYPDDADGWYELGDLYYHSGKVALIPASAFRDAFSKAIDLFPHYAESYVHLLEDRFAQRDSAGVRRLLDRYAAANIEGGWSFCPGYRLVYQLAWGADSVRAEAARALDTIPEEPLTCAWVTMAVAPEVLERAEQLDLPKISTQYPARDRAVALFRTLQARIMRGQLQAAHELLNRAYEVPNVDVSAARFATALNLSGFPGFFSARAAQAMAELDEPDDRFWLGARAVAEERWADAESASLAIEDYARELESEGGVRRLEHYSLRQGHIESLAEALRAYSDMARGEPDGAANFESALRDVRPVGWRGEYPGTFLRYQFGKLFLAQSNYRKAEQYFHTFYPYDWLHYVPAQFHLGQIYEALEEPKQAAFHYNLFVEWWQDADEELRPWVEEGREALRRVVEEPRSIGSG